MKMKLRKAAEPGVVSLPDELIHQLDWSSGDVLEADIIDGRLTMVRTETAHARALKIARKGNGKVPRCLRETCQDMNPVNL